MNDILSPRHDPLTRTLHWLMAFWLVGLLGLGFYMRTLGYYDPLYHRAVVWHRSLGMVAWILVVVRLAWRWHTPSLPYPATMPRWELAAARLTHGLLYLLMLTLPLAGYLFSTSDGRPIHIFDWFDLPALLPPGKERGELAGQAHWWLAVTLTGLLPLHILAALKHHFYDQDGILRRML